MVGKETEMEAEMGEIKDHQQGYKQQSWNHQVQYGWLETQRQIEKQTVSEGDKWAKILLVSYEKEMKRL